MDSATSNTRPRLIPVDLGHLSVTEAGRVNSALQTLANYGVDIWEAKKGSGVRIYACYGPTHEDTTYSFYLVVNDPFDPHG